MTSSYDFAWLNGPAEATYGVTVGLASAGRIAENELVAKARRFVDAFYGPGGIGETDFPNHTPADAERNDPLSLRHPRSAFDCGEPAADRRTADPSAGAATMV